MLKFFNPPETCSVGWSLSGTKCYLLIQSETLQYAGMHRYSLAQSETLQYAEAQTACTAYHPDGLLAAPLNADIQVLTLLISLMLINAGNSADKTVEYDNVVHIVFDENIVCRQFWTT